MSQLKLIYFDVHGGRGEPARLALHIGGIAFEDSRLGYAQFAEARKATPFGQFPTLQVDDVLVTQSDAITRYAGKLAGLYPTDAFQALLCDEVLGAVEDANAKAGATFRLTGDELKVARTALVEGPLSLYLRWLQAQLQAHGGEFFADQRLTIADLKVFVFVRWLNSGHLEHVPADLVEAVAPQLNAHLQRIGLTPAVAEYYAQFAA